MKVVKPKAKHTTRKGKTYLYYRVEALVDWGPEYYVILSDHEWKRILKLYDAYLALASLLFKVAVMLDAEYGLGESRVKTRVGALTDELAYCKEKGCDKPTREGLAYALQVAKRELEYYRKQREQLRQLIHKAYIWKESDRRLQACQDDELRQHLEENGIELACP